MKGPPDDLCYDATAVGSELLVETRIDFSPRARDQTFDPQPGDWVRVGDDEEPNVRGRVTRRDANKVWVQLDISRSVA